MTDLARRHREAITAFERGDAVEARRRLEEILAADDDFADVHADLGVVLRDLGEARAAADHLRRAASLAPEVAGHHYNLGLALNELGDTEAAMEAYRAAIAREPGHAAAHNNMGNLFKALRRWDEARDAYAAALAADGEFAPAQRNLAALDEEAGETDTAAKGFAAALNLRADPATRLRDALLLPVIAADGEELDHYRARLVERLDALSADAHFHLGDPVREVGATNFMLAYQGRDDRTIQDMLAALYARACPALIHEAPHVSGWEGPGTRIRIGFVSAFLGEHTIGRLHNRLIAGLDPARFEVMVFGVAGGLKVTRSALAEARLDIIYYTDIGMEPVTYFLAFSRLAPLQCVGWGHPVTTGIPTVDHFVSSSLMEPAGAEAHYSENLVRLPVLPALPERPPRVEPAAKAGRRLYLCPQSLFKLHPDFDALLAGILRADPEAELMLLAGNRPEWTDKLRMRFSRTLSGMADRVIFVPRMSREDLLVLMTAADVVLDTPHFSGGITTLEALAVGTPVVTLPGAFMRGRTSLGYYRRMGVEGGIAADGGDYVTRAVEIAGGGETARRLRSEIADTVERVFDADAVMAAFTEFFETSLMKKGPH